MTEAAHLLSRFSWLVTNFTRTVPGVAHAAVVSVDGLLLTSSAALPADRAEQLAAVAAGVVSLAQGAAHNFEAGDIRQTVIDMDGGTMLLMAIRDGSCLVALAAPACDIGQVAYEMTTLVEQVGALLTPELRGAAQAVALQSASQSV
ncbi:MAG TPA: roadblock/LC7 domain-containing protein [Pseudonocardiaceae bacterium]|jgi:hypothetical protein|nr:roadblock/LC7 domain-containing protein [Pseudonocardiaceae bacterium]